MAERKYNCKDVDMLVTSNVALENFDLYKDQLIAKRKTWADPFVPNLRQKIANALNILGVNTLAEQTAVTRTLVSMQKKAMDLLVTFKIQLEVDFEDDTDTLKQLEDLLGFSRHYKKVRSEGQEAIIELLTAVKENMTSEIRQQIEEAGTDGAIIDELIDMRDEIHSLNVKQETLKGNTPKDTALNVAELNSIYKEIIGICKIAPRLLPDVPTASDDFSFSRILSRLH